MTQASKPSALPIIDQYLKDGLLGDLGADEQRYEHLRETVTSLSTRIEEDPHSLIDFSLVAFQPKPSANEAGILSVYDTLKESWRLIDNVYPQDRPLALLKAIMLETVNRLCDSDGRLASIVYHANASAVPHYRYDRKESGLIKKVLTTAAIKAEEFAGTYYIPSIGIGEKLDFDVEIAAPENIEVNRAALQDGLFAAVGPHDEQGTAPKRKPTNQYQATNAPHWNKPFSNIASESIAQSIEETLAEFATESSSVISEKLQEIVTYVNRSKKFDLASAIETKVLWWMQSLYSPTLRSSYRDLPLPATVIAMALDLFDIVDVPCLESVVFILGEAILNATSDGSAKSRKAVKLHEWLSNFKQTEVLNEIKLFKIHHSNLENCTQPLIAAVRAALGGQAVSQEMLGDLFDVAVTPRQLGMWLFRDLLAEKLVKEHAHE
ncbi:MAG: hypothetical protein HY785_22740 [Oscillatoriophycideae cyanobacterium NC_groundwater_1537_Pr4_S-0.65um_50_18]|nr:hypothetical protein [Oscillatoriophycideae cyanobacterium NC_groundwater_1537_Pr4_S-0.65um_50_18]